ncbi:diguanylate cyclase [Oceanimonas smirnovii]|uniref:diguanylate cyclase n=1 Tax=Oceanimonas smirnovii TaxID=264574 RepID=UPI000372A770|nr:diguanylate cyclase [Oceanimonas smirnovii]
MSETTQLNQQLVMLRERFISRTAGELTAILNRLDAQQQDDLLQDCQQLLHRLAGSSGTFGLRTLGEQAALAEQWLKQQQAAGLPFTALQAKLREQLLQLTQHLTPEETPGTAVTLPAQAQCELLVAGHELAALAEALSHYGFKLHHVNECTNLPAGFWHPQLMILTSAGQLAAAISWNQDSAGDAQTATLLCATTETRFEQQYQLAEQGVDGVFTLPADVPELAEHIERLRSEHQQISKARVLLLDDDEALAEHYRLVLAAAGIQTKVLIQPDTLMAALTEFRPDILLMDIHMPPWSGTIIARMVRFHPQWLSLPIIYLSSEQDQDRQLNALAQGADEFICKPISDARLVRTVGILCRRARQLSRLVSSDGLTGLLNHPHIKQALIHEHGISRRLGHQAMVAMLDLDHFKAVNDTHGHASGDQVIRTLAHLLKRRLRNTDSLGRYGGEEFVVVLPGCDAGKARALFQKLCQDFAELDFHGPCRTFRVTVSIGLATLNEFDHAEQALYAADTALYAQKQRGRNGVTDYAELSSPATDTQVTD